MIRHAPGHHATGWAPVWAPALVILAGALLRIGLLGLDMRFHPDEALFAAQARQVAQGGDWLLRGTDLDKPPLTFYVTALAFRALGVSEFAARLPNVLFSVLSLAALYALALALYRDRVVGWVAVLLWALSPYALAFSATVFTDVQATFWTLAAGALAARDRWRGAGLAAGLAFASKSNAALFVPLIVALGMVRHVQPGWQWRDGLRRLGTFGLALGTLAGLLTLWDLARAPQSFWALGVAHNNPGRLIRAAEVGPRLEQWGHWLGWATGSHGLNTALLAMIGAWLARGLGRGRSRAAALDWLIAGFGAAFLGWHWLVAFNTYDRYLHTLIPFGLLLAARALIGVWRGLGSRPALAILIVALVITLLPGSVDVLAGRAAVGGDQGQHTGIDRLAAELNTRLGGEVVYDHWLSWELAYYLGPETRVTLAYMPLPEALAAEMQGQTAARAFVAPSPQQAAFWLALLERAGFHSETIYHDGTHGFVIYRLVPLNS